MKEELKNGRYVTDKGDRLEYSIEPFLVLSYNKENRRIYLSCFACGFKYITEHHAIFKEYLKSKKLSIV